MTQPRTIPSFDKSGLSEKEIDEARARARKKLADDIAMAELGMSDGRQIVMQGPVMINDEEQVTFMLDLYEGADRIVMDGRTFMHGGVYTVGLRQYDSICEIVARGWGHQREIEGKNSNAYRKEQNLNAETGRPLNIARN